jgi:hypothetical protein
MGTIHPECRHKGEKKEARYTFHILVDDPKERSRRFFEHREISVERLSALTHDTTLLHRLAIDSSSLYFMSCDVFSCQLVGIFFVLIRTLFPRLNFLDLYPTCQTRPTVNYSLYILIVDFL